MAVTRAVEAMGAELALGQSNGFLKDVQRIEFQRVNADALSDLLHQGSIFLGVMVGIFLQVLGGVAFEFLDDAAGDQLHLGLGG